jgi:hypothetical protein
VDASSFGWYRISFACGFDGDTSAFESGAEN